MTLASQILADNAVFFNTDEFGQNATLNSGSVAVVVAEQGVEESGDGMSDYIDIEFKAADYPAVTYRTDTCTVSGIEWKYPKVVREDSFTKLVRFRRNVRPRASR